MLISIIWWLGVIYKGPLAQFFNKHFLHFWKKLVTMQKSTGHVRHVSRNVCDNRNLRGVLARELTRLHVRSRDVCRIDRSVSLRQNSMLNIPTAIVTSHEITWREDSVSPALLSECEVVSHAVRSD
jgi:hypothetical protein